MGSIPEGLNTFSYFLEETMRFREVMGSTAYTVVQKDRAFEAIALLLINVADQQDKAQQIFESLSDEWHRRSCYEIAKRFVAGNTPGNQMLPEQRALAAKRGKQMYTGKFDE